MDPRIKYFIVLNAAIFVTIVVYVRFIRRRLKTKKTNDLENSENNFVKHLNVEYYKQTQGMHKDYKNIPILENIESETPSHSLNVVFTWNGHDWDAYEVLGIPVGSSLDEVNNAYEKALNQVDEKSQEFIKKAYRSICQKVS